MGAPPDRSQTCTGPTPDQCRTRMSRICAKHRTATSPTPEHFHPCPSVPSVSHLAEPVLTPQPDLSPTAIELRNVPGGGMASLWPGPSVCQRTTDDVPSPP